MRPLRLEMSGFSAFAEPTVVDFADVELSAFVGPTGAGKSSVIDAMTFALYGAVARYDQRTVAPVINQLATEAKVRFDFELAGTSYTAVRVVRRTKNGATTKEARLEAGDAVLAGDEKALTNAVVGLLGLDFDKFNKTVVLPQGRFAEFLHDKPSDRQELLRGLLGVGIYDRIGRAARERAVRARNAADLLDEQLAAAGDVSDEHLAALVGRAEATEAVLAAVDTIGAEIDELDRRTAAVGEQVAACVVRRDALARVAVPTGVAALDAELQAASRRAAAAADEHVASRSRHDTAAAAAAAGPSPTEMQLLLAAHDALAAAQEDLVAADGGVAGAEEAHAAAVVAASAVRRRRVDGGRGGRRRRAGQRRCCRGAANRRRPRRGAQAARRPRPPRRPGRRAGWSCRTGGRRRGGASRGRRARRPRPGRQLPRPSGSPRRRRWPSTSSSASRVRSASR